MTIDVHTRDILISCNGNIPAQKNNESLTNVPNMKHFESPIFSP